MQLVLHAQHVLVEDRVTATEVNIQDVPQGLKTAGILLFEVESFARHDVSGEFVEGCVEVFAAERHAVVLFFRATHEKFDEVLGNLRFVGRVALPKQLQTRTMWS